MDIEICVGGGGIHVISEERMDKYTSDAQDFVIIKPAPKKKAAKAAKAAKPEDKREEEPAKSE